MIKKKDVWGLLDCYFTDNPRDKATSVHSEAITAAEKVLNIKFSEPYKKFLLIYGGGGIGPIDIYGLSKSDLAPIDSWSVIENTQYYWREKWPGVENWYIVGDDDNGNPFGIDKDGVVWISDHDAYEGEEVEKVADNFEEFLYKLVTETLWD